MDNQLVALYELKRQTFLMGYIQAPERYSDALAYAYFHRIAPIFHENIALETYDCDPYEDIYSVKREFISTVLEYVDQCARAGDYKAIEFYNLEDKFGGHQTYRIELIHTLEYARIDRRFTQQIWESIESNAPAEANSLDSSFSPKDVSFD